MFNSTDYLGRPIPETNWVSTFSVKNETRMKPGFYLMHCESGYDAAGWRTKFQWETKHHRFEHFDSLQERYTEGDKFLEYIHSSKHKNAPKTTNYHRAFDHHWQYYWFVWTHGFSNTHRPHAPRFYYGSSIKELADVMDVDDDWRKVY